MREKTAIIISLPVVYIIFTMVGKITLVTSAAAVENTNPNVLLGQANKLRLEKKYNDAEKIYLQIKVENPESKQALESQMQIVCMAISQKDQKKADEAFRQMVTEYANNNNLPEAIYIIGNEYSYNVNNKLKAFEIHRYNVSNYTKNVYSMMSQVEIIRTCILDRNDLADVEIEKMINIYKDRPDLPGFIYQIGDIYLDKGNTNKAKKLYQEILDKWPDSDQTIRAKAGLIKADIASGNDDKVMDAIDKLIADCNDNRVVPHALLEMRILYLKQTVDKSEEGNNQLVVKELEPLNEKKIHIYSQVLDIMQKLIKKFPDSDYTRDAVFMAGDSLLALERGEEAIQTFQKFLDKWPNYEDSWIAQDRIIKTYKKLMLFGLMPESQAMAYMEAGYINLIEKFPNSPMTEQAKKWLDDYHGKTRQQKSGPILSKEQFQEMLKKMNKEGGQK